ncbi:GNAT family N-acetyltransferase [Roseobacter sinensis]|uniref:GNAT family N-acetyltransferase n=1 Tax=Roseobacter sinensis TaxID=2931391 RepID=A0ABT3BEA5_9RHOB|nr:GNAT family N-acetyltransferase [Roseobacter sp. WL0113]MCV3271872.1 GNAT family N-acetyltransferase [Roseobacter sp. WL0113]
MMHVRTATRDDLGQVLAWAAQEGWNPGLDDTAAFHVADPQGFFVGVADDRLVAAISIVNHTADFAFLGLYLVHPLYRGRGFGYALWREAIQHAGARTVGLDGVEAQQANYMRSGFTYAGGTTRYTGLVTAGEVQGIRAVRKEEIPDLIRREADASGVLKPAYLSAWFTDTPHRRTLVHPAGFCTVRKCREGAKIGPLLAEHPEAASQLIHGAAAVFDGSVTLDVPETAESLTRLCNDLALVPGFKTARMYRGTAPSGTGGLYAVASLELG